MKQSYLAWLIPVLIASVGAVVLEAWITHDPAADLVLHVPGMDGAPDHVEQPEAIVTIGEFFHEGSGVAAGIPGSWPGFRGANRDNILADSVPLADCWDADPPEILWTVDMGEGHAGAAIRDGRVYVLDYDETTRRDALRCLSLADGREIWRREYDVEVRRNHGMSRTVPAVSDRYVVSIGPKGHVMCVDAISGDLYWTLDLVREFGANIPMWYTGQCPLLVDDVAVLAPAGDEVLMLGVDCATGDILWQTPNPHGFEMSHASIMPAVFDGIPMFIYPALGGMVGVGADGESLGTILWYAPQWDRSVMAPSPIVFEEGRLFVTAGYGGGSMLLKVIRDGDGFDVQTLESFRSNQGFASEQQTPVLYDGVMFGILPNDAGPLRNQLVCVRPEDPGNYLWTSGRENRFGLGPYLVADGKLFVLRDDGVLVMLRATAEGYQELGRKSLMDGHDAWGPMALVDGRLVLRDDTRMICVDLRKNGAE